MPVTIQEKLSWVPFRIRICFEEHELGVGTAFFYIHKNESYLITNWHNVSGRRPYDHKPISKHAAIPDNLVVEVPEASPERLEINIQIEPENDLPSGEALVGWKSYTLNLYDNKTPTWYVHPEHRHLVDAVAIPVGSEGTKLIPANHSSLDLDNITLRPSIDAFVLGYPLGLTGGAKFPIWKRASIASEPDIDLDKLPKFLIDTATREGMSGSPVYAQVNGYYVPEETSGIENAVIGEGRRFAGIYSGRVGDDNFKAQMGVVWKEKAIVEIIEGKTFGDSSL